MNYTLIDLTKKDAFKWDEEVERALKKMKEVMSSYPILALPNFSKPFVVECDASGVLPPFKHLGGTWQKYSSHLVCPWGQVLSQGCHLVLDSSV